MSAKHTPGPWRWQGEDYRGGWGWQLLVGPHGEGILCGESPSGPYKHLRAFLPIAPEFCKTGMVAPPGSAPCVHVLQPDARLIAAAPELLTVLQDLQQSASYWSEYDVPLGIVERINAAIAKATGANP